jgi:hypothetical protein
VPGTGDDWAVQTADTIERVVGAVRGKTTEPVAKVARMVVYGLAASFLAVAALVFLAIALVRVLDVAIPGEVWPAHLVTGGIFTIAGLLCWRFGKTTSKV